MGTTPTTLIPYPEPTDRVTDGADAMKLLAQRVSALLLGSAVYGAGEAPNALVGAIPPTGTPKLRKEFTAVVNVINATGGFELNYPGGAFPNGITSVVCTPGDSASNLTAIRPVLASNTLAKFSGQAYQPNGSYVANGLGIRVNIVAVGW